MSRSRRGSDARAVDPELASLRTRDLAAELDARGVVRLPAAVDPERVAEISDRVFREAQQRLELRRSDPSSFTRVPPAIVKRARERDALFDALLTPALAQLVDAVLRPGRWVAPRPFGQLLMSPPTPRSVEQITEPWTVPAETWHLDAPAPWYVEHPGLQLFWILDPLEHGGGGTLMASGSHRWVESLPERAQRGYLGRSADVKRGLVRESRWLRDLLDARSTADRNRRFLERDELSELGPLRVVEVCGEPGDVFVMHLWTLHAPSPNLGQRMRVMATERLHAVGAGTVLAHPPRRG